MLSSKFIKVLESLLFVHCHVHSDYSNQRLRDSTNKIEIMIDYVANTLKQHGMALTDHESVSGHVKAIQTVKELKKQNKIPQDFKLILGNEIYLTSKELMNNQKEEGSIKFYHFLLLAKDEIGHKILRELSTIAWRDNYFNYKNMDRVPTFYEDVEKVIGDNKGHLIASTACVGGYLGQNVAKILSDEYSEEEKESIKDDIFEFLTWCQDMFGEKNFFIELQPTEQEELKAINQYILYIAKASEIEWMISCDCHYLSKEDRMVHKAFLTSEEDEGGSREVDSFYGTTYFMDTVELAEYLNYLEEEDIIRGIKNTNKIADMVEEYDLYHPQIVPTVPIPNEDTWWNNREVYRFAKRYEHIKRAIDSKVIYDRYLVNLALKGMREKILKDTNMNMTIEDKNMFFQRIDNEFKEILGGSEIKGEPVSSYFITEIKNIDIIWEEAESIVGTSRGSAAGFLINYLIGITQINPLVHNDGVEMPLWRFITADRLKQDFPDIDIDVPSHKRDKVLTCLDKFYSDLGGGMYRVGTFGTETAKSAIQTACRGLKINNDVGIYISSLIPVERGFVRDIRTCYYGNEEKDIKPIYEFKNAIDEYNDKGLLEVALGVEGLINKRSSHPCGAIPTNYAIHEHNALMRSPSGELATQFDLGDCEYMGGIKYDVLNTKTCGMIQITLEMLLEYGEIEWQGTLRKTYDKYLHPDVIDRTSPEMWSKIDTLISAFQYDSSVGKQALNAIKPKSLLEATSGNNLMRLMVDEGKEQPLDMYVRYKNNLDEWYADMRNYGLNEDEIATLEKHLKLDYGVCSTQEGMMLMTMDEHIANFNVVESNMARKSVAKKKKELIQKTKKLFYEKGLDIGTRKELLDYVWFVQIGMQLGYSFSVLHAIGYTYILIQQLNLIHYYNPIYWNTSVLIVESGALEQDQLENDNEEDEENNCNRKEKTTNYGTVAKAIGSLQQNNVKIALPNINKAKTGFIPDTANDEIIFGLKGVMKINNETAKNIMEMRPFDSMQDIYNKMVLNKREVILSTGKKQMKSYLSNGQMIMLIKAGAFDSIETSKTREELLLEYLKIINPDKKSFSGKAIEKVIQLGIVPIELKEAVRIYRFRNYILSFNNIQDTEVKSIKWYPLYEDYALDFFNEHFINDMEEGRDYKYESEGTLYVAMGTKRKGSFESIYQEKISPLMNWLNGKECLELYNEMTFQDIIDKEMQGNISTWEMESMNFYYHEHELIGVDKDKYDIEDFNELSDEPIVVGHTKYAGKLYPKFQLTRIAGTVLDRDKNKHIVTILTPTGVVPIKFYQGQFAFYDQTLSTIDEETEKKMVVENGWFSRGNKLLVTGFRRGDQFLPKRYKNSIYQHSVSKILSVNDDNTLNLQSERANISKNEEE